MWWHHAPLVVLLVALFIAMYPNFHAEFGITDDHEIVRYLGNDGRIAPAEVVPLIRQEIIETNGRFRPGYYLLRIIEAFVVGDNPRLWYGNRMLLAFVAAWGMYRISIAVLPSIDAATVALLFFCGSHSEIWTRLGPQESYAVPLIALGLRSSSERHRA